MSIFSNNPWVGYIERGYHSMKSALITKLQNPITGIPEITDHSDSNPFIKRVSIWCGINSQLGYYIDNKGRESFLTSARLYKSIVNIAKQYDYRIRGIIPSTGEITFSLEDPAPSSFTIPANTKLATSDGIEFLTMTAAIFNIGDTSKTVSIKQWTKKPLVLVAISNGLANQKYLLNKKIVDNSVAVLVDTTINYSPIDSFTLALANTNSYIGQINSDGIFELQFGDGMNGSIPATTKNIEAEWYESEGKKGNIGAGNITKIISVLTLPSGVVLSCNNSGATVGGTDIEGIDELKKLIPLSLRSLYRAVTKNDYEIVAELAPGVAKAGIAYECGKFVDLYIAPNGGGLASPALIASTQAFMDARKMITTFIRTNSAGLVYIEYRINVTAISSYYNTAVEAAVINSLTEFHSVDNQKIKGTITLGDIYQIIENTAGVQSSFIELMRPVPYARPLDGTTVVLNWNRSQTNTSTNATYRITFINSTDFTLLRNNVYLGTFAIATLVTTVDVEFTINAGLYIVGNKYEFKTYNTVSSIVLDEPSLPTFDVAYLTITTTGGLV